MVATSPNPLSEKGRLFRFQPFVYPGNLFELLRYTVLTHKHEVHTYIYTHTQPNLELEIKNIGDSYMFFCDPKLHVFVGGTKGVWVLPIFWRIFCGDPNDVPDFPRSCICARPLFRDSRQPLGNLCTGRAGFVFF